MQNQKKITSTKVKQMSRQNIQTESHESRYSSFCKYIYWVGILLDYLCFEGHCFLVDKHLKHKMKTGSEMLWHVIEKGAKTP